MPTYRSDAHENDDRTVVYYDGECVMCNAFVRFLAGRELPDGLRFSTQTTEAFAQLLRARPSLAEIDSVVVARYAGGRLARVEVKSSAVAGVLRDLGGPWRYAAALIGAVPVLPDLVYDLVARFRPKAASGTCPVPPASIRRRMIYA